MQQQEHLSEAYWLQRANQPRTFVLMVNTINFFFALKMWAKDVQIYPSVQLKVVNALYTINAIVIFALVVPSLWNKEKTKYIRFGFMLTALRQVSYIYNMNGDMDRLLYRDWMFKAFAQHFACGIMLNQHIHFFNSKERGHTLFTIIYTTLVIFGVYAAVFGFRDVTEDPTERVPPLLALCVVLAFLVWLSLGENVHANYLQGMFKHFSDQQFLKLVLNTHKDGLIVINDQARITFTNGVFLRQFNPHIRHAMNTAYGGTNSITSLSTVSRDRQATIWNQIWKKIAGFFACLRFFDPSSAKHDRKVARLQYARDAIADQFQKVHIFGSTPEEQCNFDAHFYDLKMFFPTATNDSRSRRSGLSINDILLDLSDLQNKIFELKTPDEAEAYLQTRAVEQALPEVEGPKKYVLIEGQKLFHQDQERILLQIIDVSDSKLYGETKEQNEMLSILNATVSHELRNPLNSIVGQNVQKEGLCEELAGIVSKLPVLSPETQALKSKMEAKLLEFSASLRIQTSSAQLMSFLVQDFLDYAQIKSEKFRINLKRFEVAEAVEKVMAIQRDKAAEVNVKLVFQPVGPLNVITDEQRVMQVLLNLQSNALKFTRSGQVTIRAEVIEAERAKFLRFSVMDTGIGIPYEDQDKLFKLFGFIQSTQQFNRNGIGLGLVISQQIVTRFGGSIEFESVPFPEENHGTTFHFTFKLETEATQCTLRNQIDSAKVLNSKKLVFDYIIPQSSQSQESEVDFSLTSHNLEADSMRNLGMTKHHEARTLSPLMLSSYFQARTRQFSQCAHRASRGRSSLRPSEKRILVVDDQIFNIKALQAVLLYKFKIGEDRIDYALNGEEALEIIAEDCEQYRQRPSKKEETELPSSYSLILMDCNMPFMDGFECTKRIREFFFRDFGIEMVQQPIVSAVTGHAEPNYISKCFSHGMNQVLSKPIEAEPLLVAMVEAGLTTYQQYEEHNLAMLKSRQFK